MVISQLGQSSFSASTGDGGWKGGLCCISSGRTTVAKRKRDLKIARIRKKMEEDDVGEDLYRV